jgi:hypothetical protein
MSRKAQFIHGICSQLLFSPKGEVEGVLVKLAGQTVQVALPPHIGAGLARSGSQGKQLHMLAVADNSHKTAESAHPVYDFESFANTAGEAVEPPDSGEHETTVKGVAAQIHFARHGQPNGVVLQTGEFIHLRPHGMALAALEVGAKVSAIGVAGTTVLGTRMLEAHQINGVELP